MNRNKKALVIFHRVDFDGTSSMCIAVKSLYDEGYQVDKTGYNYGDEIPEMYVDKNGRPYDLICMVDISFPPEIMLQVWEHYGDNFIFIDHHVSSIESSIQNNYTGIKGIREIGPAACELTWRFFYPGQDIPEFIRLLGVYDTWRKDEVGEDDWQDVILPLQSGLKFKYGLNPDTWLYEFPNLCFWEDRLTEVIELGTILKQNQDKINKGVVKSFSFPVTVAGKYRGVCVIGTAFSSTVFNSVLNDYDIYIVCNRRDKGVYSISMYKEPDRIPEFSCAGYRGIIFGHKSAGGGTLNFEQFKTLIEDCEI